MFSSSHEAAPGPEWGLIQTLPTAYTAYVGNAVKKRIPNLDSFWPILCIPVRESKWIQGVYQWRSTNEPRIHWIQGVTMNTESGIAHSVHSQYSGLVPKKWEIYVREWRVSRHLYSKALALIWYRALTWYRVPWSPPRTHFEPWKAVGTRGRGSLAAW